MVTYSFGGHHVGREGCAAFHRGMMVFERQRRLRHYSKRAHLQEEYVGATSSAHGAHVSSGNVDLMQETADVSNMSHNPQVTHLGGRICALVSSSSLRHVDIRDDNRLVWL